MTLPRERKNGLSGIRARAGAIAVAVALVFLAVVGFVVKSLLEEEGKQKKRAVQQVTLLKPPPPPPPPPKMEKPPEVKKEEVKIEEPKPEETPPEEPPPGPDLGVDAEGEAGGDAFGLVGKKGGAPLVGGGGSPMSMFGWYARIVEKEITRKLAEAGKTPSGKYQVIVKISLDMNGNITAFDLAGSSGNSQVDDLIRKAVALIHGFDRPPPEGMPTTMKVRIFTTG